MSETHASNEITVVPNAKIVGAISGVKRQLDVLIDAKWDEDTRRRIIVDAKRRKRKINVKDVESFEGMMKDCNAKYGVIVCTNGYSDAAKRRAQDAITIRLVPLEELEDFDMFAWEYCLGRCTVSRGRRSEHGLILYDSPYGIAIDDSPVTIRSVGKCDVCNEFHIWCWDCGQKRALKKIDQFQCRCGGHFWQTSIEEEEIEQGTIVRSVYLLYVCMPLTIPAGTVIPVDRIRLN